MRKRNVIILVLIFAVLVGCYLYISYRPINKNSANDKQNKIELAKYDAKKINMIVLKSEKETLELNKNGDTWTVKDNGNIKIDQGMIQDIVTSFAGLSAEKVLEDSPKDLEQYGLNPPIVTATASLDDGSEKTVLLGSKTPKGDSYYMMQNGDPKLYLLSSIDGDRFSYSLAELRDKNIFTVDPATVNYLKITLPGGKMEEMKKVEKGSPEEKQYPENTWIMTKPFSLTYKIYDQNISDIINGISAVKAEGFVSDSQSDLSKYGLDKPSLDIIVKAGGNTMHLLLSKKTDDSIVYFKVDGSNAIYKTSGTMYDTFNKQPLELIEKLIYLVNIDDINQILIDSGGKRNVINLQREKKPAGKQGEAEQVVTTYTINGKTIEESVFKNFYQSIIGILAESENDKQIPEQPDVKVTYILNKGDTKQVVLDYCPYNADFYAAFKDGKSDFLVSRDQVQKMLNDMQNLLK